MLMTPFLIWSRLALKAGDMAMSSAKVIAHRTGSLAFAGAVPSSADRREIALMGREKGEAAVESAQAVGLPLMLFNQQFAALWFKQMLSGWSALMSIAASRTPAQSVERQTKFVSDTIGDSVVAAKKLSGSGARIARSALKPVHKRVKGNVIRLKRKSK